MPPDPKPVAEIIVSYSSEAMPVEALERLQRENCDALVADEILPIDAFRVANLLLSISLLKLSEAVA